MVSFKPETEERVPMIVTGILLFYFLVVGFVYYFYFMGKLHPIALWAITLIFTAIYIPRFLIIKKLYLKDNVKVGENEIIVNGKKYDFADIVTFDVLKHKPVIVFFLSNKAVEFNETDFVLKLKSGNLEFSVIGSEKAELLIEFLEKVIQS